MLLTASSCLQPERGHLEEGPQSHLPHEEAHFTGSLLTCPHLPLTQRTRKIPRPPHLRTSSSATQYGLGVRGHPRRPGVSHCMENAMASSYHGVSRYLGQHPEVCGLNTHMLCCQEEPGYPSSWLRPLPSHRHPCPSLTAGERKPQDSVPRS